MALRDAIDYGRSWPADRGTFPFARLSASVGLLSVALTVLAAVVLLPPYAGLLEMEYQRESLAASTADTEAWITANERLIQALPVDDVLAIRLAKSQSDWLPPDEAVLVGQSASETPPPGLVTIAAHEQPTPPKGWLIGLAGHLRSRTARCASLLLVAAMILASMLLATPTGNAPTRRPGASEPPSRAGTRADRLS